MRGTAYMTSPTGRTMAQDRRRYPCPVTPHQLSDAVLAALGALGRRGALSLSGDLPAVVVERPQLAAHGDYATNVALQLAGRAGVGALELAELLAAELRSVPGVEAVTAAPPGFLNVVVAATSLGSVAAQVVADGASYGVPEGTPGLVAAAPAGVHRGLVGPDDPLHQVQYAHSRLCSLLRNGADLGVPLPSGPAAETAAAHLDHPREVELLRWLAGYPAVTDAAARRREPHRVARHLEDTAAAFHGFSDSCRVLPQGDEEPNGSHSARLLLVDATRTVLANGLHLLGVTAPERM